MHVLPTVGRVMWYYPAQGSSHKPADDQPLQASVAKVNEDGTAVNISYLDQNGDSHSMQNVSVVQPDQPTHVEGYVSWMPYQTAQAVKAADKAENQAIVNTELKK